jgi:hypothetical protein
MYKTKYQKTCYQKKWFEKHPHYCRDYQRKRRGSIRFNHKPGEPGYIGNRSHKKPKFSTLEERSKNWSNLLKERRKNNPYNSTLIGFERIEKEIPELEKQGFKCFPLTRIIPDIIALKEGKIYAIEVEYAQGRQKRKISKYKNFDYKYDDVIWILRKK